MILLILLLNFAFASISNVDYALIPSFNQLKNGGFESSKSNWTASGGTFATTTSSPMIGLAHATWDSGSASQTLTSTATTIPNGLYATNGEAFCYIKVPSGSATHKIQVYDGTNVISENTIISSTTPVKNSIDFPFPSSGSISLRIISVASDEPSISIDGCYLGESTNVGTVSQAQFVGAAYFSTTASCQWTRTNTALGAFGTDADCPGPTIESQKIGSWQTTDADLPQITINSLPPGLYRVMVTGSAGPTGASVANALAVSDGNTTTGQVESGTTASTGNGIAIEGYFEYTTSGNRTFAVHGSAASNTINIYNESGNRRLIFTIYKFPLTSQTSYTTDQSDYGVTLYTPTFTGFGTVGSNHECYHWRIGQFLYLDCKFTAGTTTATEARVSLPTGLTTAATPTAIRIAGGYGRANSSTDHGGFIFFEPSVTYVTFSAGAVYGGGSTTALSKANGTSVSGGTEVISFVAKVPISTWQVTNRAPQLINSVISEYSGVWKIIKANINCDAASAITSQSGGISSVGNRSTTSCALTITTGSFSATPYNCNVTINASTVNATSCACSSATSCTIYGPNADYDAFVSIEGPK